MAEELGWPQEAFDKAFQEIFSLGMAIADWHARLVWIPNAIKCNLPQSPNVITSWAIPWQLIPECQLKLEAHDGLKSVICSLDESFMKAFEKACPKPCALPSLNQEQEAGNRKQEGKAAASPQSSPSPLSTPEGLSQIEYAKRLLEDLGLPEAGNIVVVADSISADSKKHGLTKAKSFEFIRQQALSDQEAGLPINRFYFTDAKFRAKAGKNGNRAEQRQAANLAACAEAKRSFGLVG
jgi:hypothetical protein